MHALFVLIVALGLWITGVVFTRRQIRFLRNSTTATGTFLDWVPRRGGNSIHWYAQISFFTPDRMEHTCEVGFGKYPKPGKPPFATTVIRYVPDEPEKAQSAAWIHFWIGPLVFFGFAIALTAIFIEKLGMG